MEFLLSLSEGSMQVWAVELFQDSTLGNALVLLMYAHKTYPGRFVIPGYIVIPRGRKTCIVGLCIERLRETCPDALSRTRVTVKRILKINLNSSQEKEKVPPYVLALRRLFEEERID
jgi:hypothetical protein